MIRKPLEITIVGAIENSFERFVEKEYILMVRSLRRNGGIYKDCPIVLLQPTENHVTPRTLLELNKLGVHFIKPKTPLVVETGRGFMNMPATCAYLSQHLKTEYMVWLDCDTLVINEPMFKDLHDNEVLVHDDMEEYDRFFNDQHKADYFEDIKAQRFLCKLLTGEENLPHINTWFIQAQTHSSFWTDWLTESIRLVDLIKNSRKEVINSKFMTFTGQGTKHPILDYAISSAEEIAAGLLAKKYIYQTPTGTCHQYIDDKTLISHYDDWSVLKEIYPDPETLADIEEITKICR